MMSFFDLVRMNDLDPSEFRMVRHGNRELEVLETFRNNPVFFDAYQSFQGKNKFGNAKYIAVFAPYHGTQGLFLGVWSIKNRIVPNSKAPADQIEMVKRFNWTLDGAYYELCPVEAFIDLSERVIIEWGGSTVSWVQKKDKRVIAILPPAYVKEFESYDKTVLDRAELVKLFQNTKYNSTWYNALRSVNGIYCITDSSNGKLYVGSAYGKNGIWGRWNDYVLSGHGGNKKLMELLAEDPNAVEKFRYSILEILPSTSTADDAIAKEKLWKFKLGSKINGYNDN